MKSDFFNNTSEPSAPSAPFSSFSSSSSSSGHSVKFASSLGSDTASSSVNKTWDGYDKFNDIPVDPEKMAPTGPQMRKEELLKEKFKYLRKLETLESKIGMLEEVIMTLQNKLTIAQNFAMETNMSMLALVKKQEILQTQ